MTKNTITTRQKLALAGRLSAAEWLAEGMGLFNAGMVSLDPLADDNDPQKFRLTPAGRAAANELRRDDRAHSQTAGA